MANKLNISFDSDMLESISAEFDLRAPNKEALRQLVFTLDGDYDPDVMQVLNLATGVGKTYLMAAFVEYLRRQGVGNVVIVTPGKTVQAKTVQNFTPGTPRYITGAARGGHPAGLFGVDRPAERPRPAFVRAGNLDVGVHLQHSAVDRAEGGRG